MSSHRVDWILPAPLLETPRTKFLPMLCQRLRCLEVHCAELAGVSVGDMERLSIPAKELLRTALMVSHNSNLDSS